MGKTGVAGFFVPVQKPKHLKRNLSISTTKINLSKPVGEMFPRRERFGRPSPGPRDHTNYQPHEDPQNENLKTHEIKDPLKRHKKKRVSPFLGKPQCWVSLPPPLSSPSSQSPRTPGFPPRKPEKHWCVTIFQHGILKCYKRPNKKSPAPVCRGQRRVICEPSTGEKHRRATPVSNPS